VEFITLERLSIPMHYKYVLLTVIFLSSNCFGWRWFNLHVKPQIVTIQIADPVDFNECAHKLIYAIKQSNVVGVILRINCCGGNLGDFSMLHDLIKKLSKVKPVVALVIDSAFSCGYLVASASNYIYAHSLSAVGAIGVVSWLERHSNMQIEENGFKADLKKQPFYEGEFKVIFDPTAPDLTENQRSYFQDCLFKAYKNFINLVAQNRTIDKDNYKVWAEGRVFLAQEALELRLIDGIGTIFEAEEKIKQLILDRNPNFCSIDALDFVCL
jgi:protease-4